MSVPAIQYWLSGDVAPIVLQVVLSATLAIVAFYTGVPRKLVIGAVALMIIVVGWTWFSAAAKVELADRQQSVVASAIEDITVASTVTVHSDADMAAFEQTVNNIYGKERSALLEVFPLAVVDGIFASDGFSFSFSGAFNPRHNSLLNTMQLWTSHLRELSVRLT